MKLAIADPPYLGRAERWYGPTGEGVGYGAGRADEHPSAAEWDNPGRHLELVRELLDHYDGWAIAAAAASLPTYLAACPPSILGARGGLRILAWHRSNAPASGARVRNAWEPVLAYIPSERRGHAAGHSLDDVLSAPGPRPQRGRLGFAGAKPPEWTRWILDVLGYDQDRDTVVDLFPGSGAVTRALEQGVLL